MFYWILGLVIFWGIVFILNSTIVHKQDRSITPKQWQDMQREWKREDEEKKFEDDIFDMVIESQVEEQLGMNLPNPFGSQVYPVQIVAHKNLAHSPLVGPLYDDKGNWELDKEGKPLGYLRVEQRIQTVKDGGLDVDLRVAIIKGALDSLVNRVKEMGWKGGSQLSGKIVIKESLEPQWEGHSPDLDKLGKLRGFRYNGRFYPVYCEYRYTENENDSDNFISDEEAKSYADNHYIFYADDLPF